MLRDCPTAVSYMKDAAFNISTEEFLETPSFMQNFFLDSEIFDLHLSSYSGNKHAIKSNQSIELIMMKAEKGDPQSSLHLAYMNFYGFYGQPINHTRAFSYFYEAKLRGDLIGEAFVGYMYYQGIGIEKNLSKAYEIFRTGETKKNFRCYNGLGLMYLRGDHVEKDLSQAYSLFKGSS